MMRLQTETERKRRAQLWPRQNVTRTKRMTVGVWLYSVVLWCAHSAWRVLRVPLAPLVECGALLVRDARRAAAPLRRFARDAAHALGGAPAW